jgi:catechol 2,3-dioxygenase-like lactoylglutathione lyase family enzyme
MKLSNSRIVANVPVSDMKRATDFYGKKLGLRIVPMTDWLALAMSNDNSVLSLAMRQKVPSDEDTVNFTVSDIHETMKELKAEGITFHEYDLPRLKTVNAIAEASGFKAAWFKDSEGNTLQINQSPNGS